MKDAASEFLKGSQLTEHELSRPRRLPELPAGCFATGMLFSARQHRQNRHAAGTAECAAETPPGP